MDWIDDLIRYGKAKERERRKRMQKRKTKNPQEKSYLHKMHRKEINKYQVFLAFSCHEFWKFIFPDVEEYVNKLREDFGIGICGIRDPLGDAPNAVKLYPDSFKWYDICMDCPFSKGFQCFSGGMRYSIPESRIEEFDKRMRELFKLE